MDKDCCCGKKGLPLSKNQGVLQSLSVGHSPCPKTVGEGEGFTAGEGEGFTVAKGKALPLVRGKALPLAKRLCGWWGLVKEAKGEQ